MIRPHDLQPTDVPHPAQNLGKALVSALFLAASLIGFSALAQEKFIVMASTTSTEQSGLFGHLLPAFKQATGIDVRVVALGTGQALDSGRRGDADVVFVHDQAAEEKFVAEGFGLQAPAVMYNDFVIIGPKSDPAGVRGNDVVAALKKLAALGQRRVRVARRQERHARGRAALLEGGRRGRGRRQAGRLQGMRLRHGPGAEHRGVERTPTCCPIAAPG